MSVHLANLHEYIDGELDTRAKRNVEEHLQGCEACRRIVSDIRRLRSDTMRLPEEISPSRDLWPQIAARLAPAAHGVRPSSPWVRPLMAAALLMLAFTGVLLHYLPGEKVSRAEGTVADAVMATFDATEREATVATEAVLAELDVRRDTPAAQAARALLKNIRVVDGAIRALRDALQADPGDAGVVRRLRREYQRKATLIRQTAHLLDQIDRALAGVA